MISEIVSLYCKEDPSLIENYDKAINDNTQIWECHHRLETDLNLSMQELKDRNLYYDRPPSELIFLTKAEHSRIHYEQYWSDPDNKKKQSEKLKQYYEDPETRKKKSEQKKQYYEDPENRKKQSEKSKQYWLDPEYRNNVTEKNKQYWSDTEKRKQQSERMKGENNPMYGKNPLDYMTPEARLEKSRKQSEKMKGHPGYNKGKHRVYDNQEKTKYHMEFNIF